MTDVTMGAGIDEAGADDALVAQWWPGPRPAG